MLRYTNLLVQQLKDWQWLVLVLMMTPHQLLSRDSRRRHRRVHHLQSQHTTLLQSLTISMPHAVSIGTAEIAHLILLMK